ncbi:PIN-like domain-containing protein, partial [Mycobacteroides abscessus]
RFVSATGQFLLATYGQFSCPPTGNFSCPLTNLYRYNEQTLDDLLAVASAVGERLFVPHQVVREFWRNRQGVIAGLGSASKDAQNALTKNATSTKDAITRWAKSVALPDEQCQQLAESVDDFYEELRNHVGNEPVKVSPHAPTSRDELLTKLESLLENSVGPALAQEDWDCAVKEGERRVAKSIPPGA